MGPTLELNSGTQFPAEVPLGKLIPVWRLNLGCSFRLRADPETASHSGAEKWDAVSPGGLSGKVRPILRVDSGTRFPERALWENASHSGRRPNAHITRP